MNHSVFFCCHDSIFIVEQSLIPYQFNCMNFGCIAYS